MMSRIDGLGPIRTPQPLKRASKTSGASTASFSSQLEGTEESNETGASQSAGALGSVSGVLDLQEVDDALARAARGKLRAEDLLQHLDDLRLDILTGAVPREKLRRLSQLVASRRQTVDDPKLGEIFDEIDLRAQVELAKFEQM